ncbi:LacI family DNA-binding transcriptional regulator [Sanguibacter gelidistatuariae]|uniref:LacI family DNA-binding transcriptional regulator n=1 Tax=Sanguibacter gelidistatuariae TaxID=1814289 RepID=UPI001FDF4CC6|nr:LacI family DNA-binding transcriptional regulator [Sanguibacter gelidistatuariae]
MEEYIVVSDKSALADDAIAAVPEPAPRRRTRSGGAPTIYDIAQLAGVNPSTVSRALNQPGRINAKTEARVRAAAKELDYHANPMARALPTGRTNTLGLFLADITNPMVFDVVRGAERAATAAGLTLVIAESQESGDLEETAIERLLPSVDGVVLATTRLSDERILALTRRKPVVLMNREVDGVTSVVPDIGPGVDETVAHLHGLGHRSIVYLSGPTTSWMSGRRWDALSASVVAHGMSLIEIGPNAPTLAGGRDAFARVQLSGATAVVAYNDLMAIGLLREASLRGVVFPDNLSIVGFDDIFGSDFTSPPLTTVRSPLLEAGTRAVDLVLHAITTGDQVTPCLVTGDLTTELVVRGSTGAPQAT